MSAIDLNQGGNSERNGQYPIEGVVIAAEESINGFDPNVSQRLRNQVELGYAVALEEHSPQGVHFIGCAMPLGPDIRRLTVMYIDSSADLFTAQETAEYGFEKAEVPAGNMIDDNAGEKPEAEVEVLYEHGDAAARAALSQYTADELMKIFYPGARPVPILAEQSYDIHGARTSLLTTLHHDREAWRSSIFAAHLDEVEAAVDEAFAIAPALGEQREASRRRIGSVILKHGDAS